MRKRTLAAPVISALLAFQTIAGAVPIAAAGTSSDGLATADSVKKDADAVKFRGDEWTGTDYTVDGETRNSVDDFGIAREQAATLIYPWKDDAEAQNGVWDYNARENAKYVQMLTGEGEEWKLNVLLNPTEAAKYEGEDGFASKNFSNNAWKSVTLPCSWTMQGFDFSIYTNQSQPWQSKYGDSTSTSLAPAAPTNYNPTGLYRKVFTLKDGMKDNGRRVYINFQGVESAYYVYVNGKEVGYSEDTFSPHHFDITEYLTEGENVLAVKVLKFCDAVWMEDQDMLYDGGIFRDVFLTSAPNVQIRDYTVITDLDENYENAVLKVDADISNLTSTDISGWTLEASVYDRDGKDIIADKTSSVTTSVASTKEEHAVMNINVTAPKLWSAEHPNLYALVLRLKDGNGKVVETVSKQLGFREIEFTRAEVGENGLTTTTEFDNVLLNGEVLFMKGADRHDTDPVYGKATPQSSVQEDLRLMKQNNLNAIRTSHYSNDDYLYWLANEWGMYILAETNVECHALYNSTNNGSDTQARFYNMIMDRQESAFERLKNDPCVLIWSIGNECGRKKSGDTDETYVNFAGGVYRDAIAWFKEVDATRPVLFESFYYNMGGDIHAEQYPSVSYVNGWGGEGRIPYLLSEFDHSMGNSTGDLDSYMEVIRKHDNIIGCFIWDWVDQTRYTDLESIGLGWDVADSKAGLTGEATGTPSDLTKGQDSSDTLNASGTSLAGTTVMNSGTAFNSKLAGSNQAFTLEVNLKPAAGASDNPFITIGDDQVSLKTNKNNQLEFFVYDSTWRAASWDLPANWGGNWWHVAAVYDNGNVTVYLNGEVFGTASLTVGTIKTSSYNLGIGAETQNNRKLSGEISVARIYNKALSAAEVKGQYSATPAITAEDDSVLFWLDYGKEGTLTSKTGNLWDYYASEDAHGGMYLEEGAGKFLGYGGDWGDNPNSGSFCANGLVSGNRDPQPELDEVKYQYQNLWFTASDMDVAAGRIQVENENRFTNLNEYALTWSILEDGKEVASGPINGADVAPMSTGIMKVAYEMPAELKDGAEYSLNITAALKNDTEWAKAGHVLSYEQFVLPAAVAQAEAYVSQNAAQVEEGTDKYSVTGENFAFEIAKDSGQMLNYIYDGDLLIQEGPKPNFWRCPTENDEAEGSSYYDRNWRNAVENITVDSIDVQAENGQQIVTVNITLPDAGDTSVVMVYTIDDNGAVNVDTKVDATSSSMGAFISVGTMMTLPEGFEGVQWYGKGPREAMADRVQGSKLGLYDSTVSANFYPYIKVDDTGRMFGTRYMRLSSDASSTDVMIVAQDEVQASALHFTPYDLDSVSHPYALTPRSETIVTIDTASKGTGSATCGPATQSAYMLPSSVVYQYSYTILPVASSATEEEAAQLYRQYHEAVIVDPSDFDQRTVDEFLSTLNTLLVVDDTQKAEVEALQALYEDFTEDQKALVPAMAKAKLDAAAEKLGVVAGKTAYLQDRSSNGYTIPTNSAAEFEMKKGQESFRGYLPLEVSDNKIDDVISGTNDWSVTVKVIPTAMSGQNYFAGKGDYSFAVRTEGSAASPVFSFHVSDGSSWYAFNNVAMTEEMKNNWLGNEHEVTAVMDNSNLQMRLYVDGQAMSGTDGNPYKTLTSAINIPATDYDVNVGRCPQTNRLSDANFTGVRIFNKALNGTEAKALYEVSDDSIMPTDACVALWVDFDDIHYEDLDLNLDYQLYDLLTASKPVSMEEYSKASLENFAETFAWALSARSCMATQKTIDDARDNLVHPELLDLRLTPSTDKLEALQ